MWWLTALLLGWGMLLGAGWLSVETWLRRLPLPAPGEADASAARRLWRQGRSRVLGYVGLAGVVVCGLPTRSGLAAVSAAGPGIRLMLAALGAVVLMTPAALGSLLILRLALRKQLPHLGPHLPGWWER